MCNNSVLPSEIASQFQPRKNDNFSPNYQKLESVTAKPSKMVNDAFGADSTIGASVGINRPFLCIFKASHPYPVIGPRPWARPALGGWVQNQKLRIDFQDSPKLWILHFSGLIKNLNHMWKRRNFIYWHLFMSSFCFHFFLKGYYYTMSIHNPRSSIPCQRTKENLPEKMKQNNINIA